jgi:hypothetical protein
MRAKTSASQAFGSMSLSRAVMMSVAKTAARSAPRSEPANNHAFLPRAKPRSSRSAALLVKQITRAWLAGTLPGRWDVLSKCYFEQVKKRKADYVKAREEYGHAAVSERRVNW